MAIERRVTELAGPVGGQAAHRALAQRPGRDRHGACSCARTRRARGAGCAELMGGAARRWPSAHLDWPMPGYTHLQRAQPVYLAHHLLAYFWMLERDRERFAAVVRARPASCRSARARWPA